MTNLSLKEAKQQAKRLRETLASQGTAISHSDALELVAKQHSARNWNTLAAQLKEGERCGLSGQAGTATASTAGKPTFALYGAVSGQYLGQPFTGQVVSLAKVGHNLHIALQLDAPVDVVRFESFSSLRSHIRATITPDGRSLAHTSDGQPQLVVVPSSVR